jgi:DNA-binding IclR family transcriptional regulator
MADHVVMHTERESIPESDVPSRWVAIMQRVRTEYEEMPGLSVTVAQASRLWNIDAATTREVLNAMVDVGYLSAGPRGFTLRAFDGSARVAER